MRLKFIRAGTKVSAVLNDVSDDISVGVLKERALGALKLSGRIDFLVGFPPRLLDCADAVLAASVIVSGSVVEVRSAAIVPEAAPQNDVIVDVSAGLPNFWACAACTLVNEASATTCSVCGGRRPLISRFVVPADNSCLFSALGMLLDEGLHRADRAQEMRRICADSIRARADDFGPAMLGGKSAAEYADYIQSPEIWGGGIEMSVLADHFGVQIVCVNIQTKGGISIFGEDRAFTRRVFVIYDGRK